MWASLPFLSLADSLETNIGAVYYASSFVPPLLCVLYLGLRWKRIADSRKVFLTSLFISASAFWFYISNVANTKDAVYSPVGSSLLAPSKLPNKQNSFPQRKPSQETKTSESAGTTPGND